MNINTLYILLCCSIGAIGCNPTRTNNQSDDATTIENSATRRVALCVGLDKLNPNAYNGWNGACPGAVRDADGFSSLFKKQRFDDVVILKDSDATWNNVKTKLMTLALSLNSNDLLVFTYSGHGGQSYTTDILNEPDGYDETFCFYDGQVIDNTMADLLAALPRGIRIFMITDCCHSESNFQISSCTNSTQRSASAPIIANADEFNSAICARLEKTMQLEQCAAAKDAQILAVVKSVDGKTSFKSFASIRLLHISGCLDSESSYGSNLGGELTNSMLEHFSNKSTYEQWFNASKKLPSQTPTMLEVGESFKTTLSLQ